MTDRATGASARTGEVALRPARPEEAPAISALAMRSKGHWGYDADFLDACRDDLTIHSSWCDGIRLVVAERAGVLLGYSRISGDPPVGELDGLFVDPSAMRQGLGTKLLRQAVGCARRLGMVRLSIDSDPYAEPFYRRAGAVRVGEAESTVFPGRVLPRLELAVDQPPG
jgi:GNAT superfamily N-acetyltransferase